MYRQLSLALCLGAVVACGSDTPTGLAGSQMSVVEQVSIEPALLKVVSALEATRSPADSNLANWTRIVAHLIRLQGQQGYLRVTNSAPPASAPDSMSAASMLITQGSGASAVQLHYVVAWQGLDVINYTVSRAVILLADGNGATSGTFDLAGAGGVARYVDLQGGGPPYVGAGGALTVGETRFDGHCPGLESQEGNSCAIGRESITGSLTATRADAPSPLSLSWPASALPAFHLTSVG